MSWDPNNHFCNANQLSSPNEAMLWFLMLGQIWGHWWGHGNIWKEDREKMCWNQNVAMPLCGNHLVWVSHKGVSLISALQAFTSVTPSPDITAPSSLPSEILPCSAGSSVKP